MKFGAKQLNGGNFRYDGLLKQEDIKYPHDKAQKIKQSIIYFWGYKEI